MPAHLRWELYPLPHGSKDRQMYGGSYFEEAEWWTKSMEPGRLGELRAMLQEIFLLRGVWAHFRELWIWSWLLHIGLYLLIGVAALGLASAVAATTSSPATAGALAGLTRSVAWIGVSAGLAGTLGLLAMRVLSARLRPFSSRATFFNLAMIAAIFATGVAGLLFDGKMVASMIGVLGSLLGLGEMPHLSAIAAGHIGVVAVFLAYFPFTHMTHAYMKYFAYHEVRWDDVPSARDRKVRKSIAHSLEQPVSWAAPHIGSQGSKRWVDVVSSKGRNVEQKS
jgi:nitrate reductase gamma subunit